MIKLNKGAILVIHTKEYVSPMVCMSYFVRLYCHSILIISNRSFILCSDLLKIYDLKINKGFCLIMFDLLIHKLMFSVY